MAEEGNALLDAELLAVLVDFAPLWVTLLMGQLDEHVSHTYCWNPSKRTWLIVITSGRSSIASDIIATRPKVVVS